jgi:hypothetical protein
MKFSTNQILVLIVFLCAFSIFLRPTLFGYDSYATLNLIQNNDSFGLNNIGQIMANQVWLLLPNNLFLLKLLMFTCLFITCLGFFRLGKLFFDSKTSLIIVFLLLAFSPKLLFGFGELENEILAWPFLVWFVVFLFEKKWFKSFGCLLIGSSFWVWFYYLTFLNDFAYSYSVEMRLFGGLFEFWLLLPFIFCIFFVKDRRVLVGGVLCLLFVLINVKLFIFLYCFLVFGIGLLVEKLLNNKQALNMLLLMGVFMVLGFNVAFLLQSPTPNDWFFVDEAIKISEESNLPLYNDMGYGYWLRNKNYLTEFTGGTNKVNYEDLNKPFIALTKQDLNCELIKEETFLARTKKIYKC